MNSVLTSDVRVSHENTVDAQVLYEYPNVFFLKSERTSLGALSAVKLLCRGNLQILHYLSKGEIHLIVTENGYFDIVFCDHVISPDMHPVKATIDRDGCVSFGNGQFSNAVSWKALDSTGSIVVLFIKFGCVDATMTSTTIQSCTKAIRRAKYIARELELKSRIELQIPQPDNSILSEYQSVTSVIIVPSGDRTDHGDEAASSDTIDVENGEEHATLFLKLIKEKRQKLQSNLSILEKGPFLSQQAHDNASGKESDPPTIELDQQAQQHESSCKVNQDKGQEGEETIEHNKNVAESQLQQQANQLKQLILNHQQLENQMEELMSQAKHQDEKDDPISSARHQLLALLSTLTFQIMKPDFQGATSRTEMEKMKPGMMYNMCAEKSSMLTSADDARAIPEKPDDVQVLYEIPTVVLYKQEIDELGVFTDPKWQCDGNLQIICNQSKGEVHLTVTSYLLQIVYLDHIISPNMELAFTQIDQDGSIKCNNELDVSSNCVSWKAADKTGSVFVLQPKCLPDGEQIITVLELFTAAIDKAKHITMDFKLKSKTEVLTAMVKHSDISTSNVSPLESTATSVSCDTNEEMSLLYLLIEKRRSLKQKLLAVDTLMSVLQQEHEKTDGEKNNTPMVDVLHQSTQVKVEGKQLTEEDGTEQINNVGASTLQQQTSHLPPSQVKVHEEQNNPLQTTLNKMDSHIFKLATQLNTLINNLELDQQQQEIEHNV